MTTIVTPSVIDKKKVHLPNNGRHPPATQQWSSQVRLVTVAPTEQPGHFSAEVNGELIVESSRQPFCDAARVLVERGCDTNSTLIMRHAGSDTNCLIGKIGIAAKLTVAEGERDAPRYRAWTPMPSREGSPSMRLNGRGLPTAPRTAAVP